MPTDNHNLAKLTELLAKAQPAQKTTVRQAADEQNKFVSTVAIDEFTVINREGKVIKCTDQTTNGDITTN